MGPEKEMKGGLEVAALGLTGNTLGRNDWQSLTSYLAQGYWISCHDLQMAIHK